MYTRSRAKVTAMSNGFGRCPQDQVLHQSPGRPSRVHTLSGHIRIAEPNVANAQAWVDVDVHSQQCNLASRRPVSCQGRDGTAAMSLGRRQDRPIRVLQRMKRRRRGLRDAGQPSGGQRETRNRRRSPKDRTSAGCTNMARVLLAAEQSDGVKSQDGRTTSCERRRACAFLKG